MSRRRERLIEGSRSLPVGAASRALRGDADGTTAVREQRSRLLVAETVGMLERAGPMVRGASEVVACRLNAIAAQGETCLKVGEVGARQAPWTLHLTFAPSLTWWFSRHVGLNAGITVGPALVRSSFYVGPTLEEATATRALPMFLFAGLLGLEFRTPALGGRL